METELGWEPPGAGVWWATPEHFPHPVSRLFATIFPDVTAGWQRGAERYGLPMGPAQWATVNGWVYFSPGAVDPATFPSLVEAAQQTLASAPWRDEVRRWFEEERPAAEAANRSLQAERPASLDDAGLADHVARAIGHFHRWAPLHFEHTGFDLAGGQLFLAARQWGLERSEVANLLAGASPATSAVDRHLEAIAEALDQASADPPTTLADVRRASPAARDALHRYLDEYGWRPITGHDLAEPTFGESPELVVATINARRARRGRRPSVEAGAARDGVRAKLAPDEQGRFDELLDDARSSYALRDDDVGVCWNWPLGLVRRAVLEAGRRLADRGRLDHPDHAFEASPAELALLLTGNGPNAGELADRAALRGRAAALVPPVHLGEAGPGLAPDPLPPPVAQLDEMKQATWAFAGGRHRALHGLGVGTTPATGRACVVRHPSELHRLVEGDVLITITTTTAFNAVFELLAAVATQEGGLFSHTAILARELALPAVVGVADLLELVGDGDQVEVDPVAGQVRVVEVR